MDYKRIEYIDQTKGVGMLLIVIARCFMWWPRTFPTANLASLFHVPIFFFAIGVLYAELNRNIAPKQLAMKRLWQLMLPYILFSIINSLVKFAGMIAMGTFSTQAICDELPELLITGNGTVWFLPCLFFAELLFCATKRLKVLPLLCIGALLIPILYASNTPIAVFVRRIPVAYFFIVCGYFVTPLMKATKSRCVVGAACVITAYLIEAFHTSKFSFFGSNFNSSWIEIPQCLLGCIGVTMALQGLSKRIEWLENIGKQSLGIMLIHPTILLFFAFGIIPHLRTISQPLQIIGALATTLIVLLSSIAITKLVDKKFPLILGKRKSKGNS